MRGPLEGRTAAVLRGPGRAGGILAELASRGATGIVCPLIDFELPDDTSALDRSIGRLLDGGFAWMVLTSRTTVEALVQRCRALGVPLAVPESTRVAAVGDATRTAAESVGIIVDLVPAQDHSAVGILAAWPSEEPGSVYLPQADIAAPTLEAGLAARGWTTVTVAAYRTVDAPADPARRVGERLPGAAGEAAPSVTPQRLAELLAGPGGARGAAGGAGSPTGDGPATGIGAVFLTSPSIARRFHGLAPAPHPAVAVVAIGHSTAAEARRLGLSVAATAALPTPRGLCDAWESALHAAASPSGPPPATTTTFEKEPM